MDKNLEGPDLDTGDWVLILSSLFLGVVALFVPYLAERLKRSWFAPNLNLSFNSGPPDCHLTRAKKRNEKGEIELDEPDFYFRFRVQNNGKSQARRCEAVVERLYVKDASDKYVEISQFTPINLVWGSGNAGVFSDINPGRWFSCDLCHIPSLKLQNINKNAAMYVDNRDGSPSELGVVLCQNISLHSQPNRLLPGKYKIDIGVYSENAPKIAVRFEIAWTGIWRESDSHMLREAVVSLEQ